MNYDMTSGEEATMQALCAMKAVELWETFTPAEKTCTRFGMLPVRVLECTTKEGYDSRILAVALFQCAKRDGGMIA